MKVCPVCNNSIADDSVFCAGCGSPVTDNTNDVYSSSANYQNTNVNNDDHTAEFDAKDISENKLWCMLVYLTGLIGVIIALLLNNNSSYLKFHVRQEVKFIVLTSLLTLVASVLSFTFIVPIAAIICIGVLNIIRYICLYNVFQGKAVDAPIIKNIKFLD